MIKHWTPTKTETNERETTTNKKKKVAKLTAGRQKANDVGNAITQ